MYHSDRHEGELEHDDRGYEGHLGAVQEGPRREVPRLDEEQGATGAHRVRTPLFRYDNDLIRSGKNKHV